MSPLSWCSGVFGFDGVAHQAVVIIVQQVEVTGGDTGALSLEDGAAVIALEEAQRAGDDIFDTAGVKEWFELDVALLPKREELLQNVVDFFANIGVHELIDVSSSVEQPEQIHLWVFAAEHAEAGVGEQVRRHDHVVLAKLLCDADCEFVCVLLIALVVDVWFAIAHDIPGDVDGAAAFVKAVSIGIDAIAKGIEGLSKDDVNLGIEGDEVAHKLDDLVNVRRLVIFDDIAERPGLLEVVVDEALALEDEVVIDGTRDDIDIGFVAFADQVVCVGGECGPEESLFDAAFDAPGASARPTREKELVVAVLKGAGGIFFEDIFVELGFFLAIDAVGSEVAHKEAEQRVGKEIESCAIRKRRESQVPDAPPHERRIEIADVGGGEDHGAAFGELLEQFDFAAEVDAIFDAKAPGKVAKQALWRHRVEHEPKTKRKQFGGKLVDFWIEVSGDFACKSGDSLCQHFFLHALVGVRERLLHAVPKGFIVVAALRRGFGLESTFFVVDRVV